MPTSTLSVRLDSELKEQGIAAIRRKGLTPASVITTIWREIVETGTVPGMDVQTANSAAQDSPFERMMAARAKMPLGTPLSRMDGTDLKKELADRD